MNEMVPIHGDPGGIIGSLREDNLLDYEALLKQGFLSSLYMKH